MIYRKLPGWKSDAIWRYCEENKITTSWYGDDLGMSQEDWQKVRRALPTLFSL